MAYKSKFTGAQIDEYLEKAKNENLQTIGAAPARNLLHNWYFAGAEIWCKKGSKYFTGTTEIGTLSADTLTEGTLTWGNSRYDITVDGTSYTVSRLDCYQKPNTGPVNQRGAVSYSGAGYTIDRWKGIHGGSGIVLTSDGLVVTSTNNANIEQVLETPISGTVTYSLLYRAGSRARVYFFFQDGTNRGFSPPNTNEAFDVAAFTVTATEDNPIIGVTFSNTFTNGKFVIKGVKLELGTQQTLAHQENGEWVPNEYPDYAEELRRCQRYLFPLDYVDNSRDEIVGFGHAHNDTQIRFFMPTPVPIRLVPSVVYQSGSVSSFRLRGNGSSLSPSAIVVSAITPSGVYGFCTVSGAVAQTAYDMCVVSGRMLLSAEL